MYGGRRELDFVVCGAEHADGEERVVGDTAVAFFFTVVIIIGHTMDRDSFSTFTQHLNALLHFYLDMRLRTGTFWYYL